MIKKEFTNNSDEESESKIENEIPESARSNLNIQSFMDDMQKLGSQINNRDLRKPDFFYGDLGVTNYLLWILIGETMMLNDKLGEE